MFSLLQQILDFRGRRYARERAAIEEAVARGRPDEIVAAVRAAVARWSWNWEDGSRRSSIRDCEHLLWVLQQAAADSLPGPALERITQILGGLLAFFGDRSNFRIDGRMVRPGSVARAVTLHQDLKTALAEIRRALCQDLRR